MATAKPSKQYPEIQRMFIPSVWENTGKCRLEFSDEGSFSEGNWLGGENATGAKAAVPSDRLVELDHGFDPGINDGTNDELGDAHAWGDLEDILAMVD